MLLDEAWGASDPGFRRISDGRSIDNINRRFILSMGVVMCSCGVERSQGAGLG